MSPRSDSLFIVVVAQRGVMMGRFDSINRRWLAALVAGAGLALAGCAAPTVDISSSDVIGTVSDPVVVEPMGVEATVEYARCLVDQAVAMADDTNQIQAGVQIIEVGDVGSTDPACQAPSCIGAWAKPLTPISQAVRDFCDLHAVDYIDPPS
jgi:hypothetical protein